jgi:eukaryotic-like serine/threonine-protein kinase
VGVRSRVGNYEVIAEVADTALGNLSVGRALLGDERGRLVLLRRLERGKPLGDADLASVRESAIAALRIHDAGVLAVLELLPVENGLVIVSEYIEGLPLRAVLEAARSSGAPLPGPVAVRLGSDLLRAVLGAKRALAEATVLTPLVGLTPDGVLLASSGDVMISGLGLAMLARPIDSPALLAYRSPEHFSGSVPDERSEVYSVGVLLWELLAGKNPLVESGRARADLLEQIRTVGLPRLDRVAPPSLSPAVAELVMQAVARDPAHRIPNLGALANALMALGKAHNVRLNVVLKALDPLVRGPLERLRAALEGAQQGVPENGKIGESMRPTYRPPAPVAPRAARAIGLAAFPRAPAVPQIEQPSAGPSTEAARRIDDLLGARTEAQPKPMFPVPVSGATRTGIGPAADEDRRQLEAAMSDLNDMAARGVPGLPVGKRAPIPLTTPAAPAAPPSTRAAPRWSSAPSRATPLPAGDLSTIDAEALRPRPARKLALVFVVLLVLGAAAAIGVVAIDRMQQQTAATETDSLPGLPAPQVGGAEPGGVAPAGSETVSEETGQRVISGNAPGRPRAPIGAFRPRAPIGLIAAPMHDAGAVAPAPEPASPPVEPPPPAAAAAPPSEPVPGMAMPRPAAPSERGKEPLEENPY